MLKNKIIIFYGLLREDLTTDWIPYGPLLLYSILKDAGFSPVLIQEFIERDYEYIFEKYADEVLFFGVSAMTGYQITSGIKAVKKFKEYAPDTPIVWGGAHATAVPYQTLQSKYVDYVCVGHAKQNIINFTKALQSGRKPSGIPDILSKAYFTASKTINYSIKDYKIEHHIFPRYALKDFDFSHLITSNNVLNYTSSIGCFGQCSFCSWGGKHPWIGLSPENVLDDIEDLIKHYNISSLWFSDASMLANKTHILEIAKGIIDRKLNIFWRCNGRFVELNKFTTLDLKILEKSGLEQILLGIENVNLKIQKMYRKIFSLETATKILRKMKRFDICLYMSFIFGNPDGPLTDLEENKYCIDKWNSINPNLRFIVGMYVPYPGTPISDLAISLGYNPASRLEEYANDHYFTDKQRHIMDLPWLNKKDRDDYINRCYKLFPIRDYSQRKYRKGQGTK